MIRFGVIGYGYWGPNIVRNLHALDSTRVTMVCDKNPAAIARLRKSYPDVEAVTEPMAIVRSPEIDAVAVITPVWTHYELAKAALENGKHVFVEKPFTSSIAQAEELIELAARKKLLIMVDHTFLFTGAVKKIAELIESGVLGDLYYYDSLRVNLGLFQHDVSVIWDLAPHDLSIMDHLIKREPEAIVATGEKHLNGVEDVAYITVYFPESIIAHINVNWLSPVKIRTTLVGGQKKMLVWNDLVADEKVRVYDKGVDITSGEGLRDVLVSYRTGDMWAPQVQQIEALRAELDYFAKCISASKTPFNDGMAGLRIVRMLEAADRSIQKRGLGAPVSEYCSVAADVKLGKNVKLSKFINLYGCEIGENTKIGAFVEIQKNAKIGCRCKISSHSFICEGVTIEDNVFVGHGVTFINDSYPRATTESGELQTEKDWKVEDTLVKRGASIGSGATILSRVIIGENSIVGAGSVVTRDVPANVIIAGNPAKVLRKIDNQERVQDESVPQDFVS